MGEVPHNIMMTIIKLIIKRIYTYNKRHHELQNTQKYRLENIPRKEVPEKLLTLDQQLIELGL